MSKDYLWLYVCSVRNVIIYLKFIICFNSCLSLYFLAFTVFPVLKEDPPHNFISRVLSCFPNKRLLCHLIVWCIQIYNVPFISVMLASSYSVHLLSLLLLISDSVMNLSLFMFFSQVSICL